MATRTTDNHNPSSQQVRWLIGLGLVLTGLFVMVGNTAGAVRFMGLVFLLGLGLIILLWGIFAHTSGPIIPGALLTGVSAGALLTQAVFALESVETAGVHALAVAGGFLLITLLTGVFAGPPLWWPLIPGILLLLGGLNLLLKADLMLRVGDFWPLAMIAAGMYLLLPLRQID